MAPAAEWERAGADAVQVDVMIMRDAWQPAGHLGLWAREWFSLDLIWAALGLVAAVLAGVIVIHWVQRWQRRGSGPAEPEDELANYRDLFERGLLSPEEFERIRTRLEGKPPQKLPPNPAANGAPPADNEPPHQGQGKP